MIVRARADIARVADSPDRVFLDANVLFSAAYRAGSGLEKLWKLTAPAAALVSSPYAIEEARRNLDAADARQRLERLVAALEIVRDLAPGELPLSVDLPPKDQPILLSAIAARATHLLTGDHAHFGAYFGRRISSVLIARPGDYLASRS